MTAKYIASSVSKRLEIGLKTNYISKDEVSKTNQRRLKKEG
jgi:hypothetical protein